MQPAHPERANFEDDGVVWYTKEWMDAYSIWMHKAGVCIGVLLGLWLAVVVFALVSALG